MPKRILVVRADRIGDLINTTPLFRALKTRWPDAEITALVHPQSAPVLEHNPFVAAIWTDDAQGEHRGREGFWRQVRRIREERFDTALVAMARTRWVAMVRLAGIPNRLASTWRPSNTIWGVRSVPHRRTRDGRHESDYALDMARVLGVQIAAREFLPEVFVTDAETEQARAVLRGAGITGPPITVHPGFRTGPNLPIGTYQEIAAGLAAAGHPVIITGASAEAPDITAAFGDIPGVFNLAGKFDLRGLAAVLRECALFVGGSTGPMHLAAAVGTPVVAAFCRFPAVHPRRWGPLGNEHRIVTVPVGGCARCDGGNLEAECALPALSSAPLVAAALEQIPLRR